jgi:polyisoprenoid-binding protein YceI
METTMTQLASNPQTQTPDLTQGVWAVDPAHSNARFEVGHPHLAKVRGTIPVMEGWLRVGPALATTAVNLAFDPAGVHTGQGERDALLRGPNFFDVESFPVWSFHSKTIARTGHQLAIEGDLTMHGLTREAMAVAQFEGTELLDDAVPQASFTADSQIDRLDYGLDWTDQQAHSRRRTAREVSVGVHLLAILKTPGR